eukprot:TRINITY_DN6612_c0_g3_i3.p1 TRINITY_DN6612_c0_g3~~TRINITY_DN6612_c0_g3_i3.p1  ORF type:complete len:214 (+),score=26.71 TRINITY_DN6612_c0_g3_i3:435-1076(+)
MVFDFIEQLPIPEGVKKKQYWTYISKLAEAIEGVHNCNIVHTDIKLGNVLYSNNEEVYLIDFEDSFFHPNDDDYPQDVGTISYMAPEVAMDLEDSNDFPRDVWAFGILVYRLFFQHFPFDWLPEDDDNMCEESEILLKSINESLPIFQGETLFRNPYQKLIKFLFLKIAVVDPKKRPEMKDVRRYIQIIGDDFINEVGFNSPELLTFEKYKNI